MAGPHGQPRRGRRARRGGQPVRGQEAAHRRRPAEPLGPLPGQLPAPGGVPGAAGAGWRRRTRRRCPRRPARRRPPPRAGRCGSLTTTGVPLASASSADSPNVSAGPGAMATSAVASSRASSPRSATCRRNRTGRPPAWARSDRAAVARRPPPPAPRARRGGAVRPARRWRVPGASPGTACCSAPAAAGPGRRAGPAGSVVGAGAGGSRPDRRRAAPGPGCRRRKPAELRRGPRGGADDDVVAGRRVAVQPVGQPVARAGPGGANIAASAARLSCETIIDRIPRAPGPAAGPAQRGPVGHLEPVRAPAHRAAAAAGAGS